MLENLEQLFLASVQPLKQLIECVIAGAQTANRRRTAGQFTARRALHAGDLQDFSVAFRARNACAIC